MHFYQRHDSSQRCGCKSICGFAPTLLPAIKPFLNIHRGDFKREGPQILAVFFQKSVPKAFTRLSQISLAGPHPLFPFQCPTFAIPRLISMALCSVTCSRAPLYTLGPCMGSLITQFPWHSMLWPHAPPARLSHNEGTISTEFSGRAMPIMASQCHGRSLVR